MDYLEFKKALQAIGEAEKAGEYWEFINGIQREIICINNSYSNFSLFGRFYQAKYYPELDLIIEKIRNFNPELTKVLLGVLLKSELSNYWNDTAAFDFVKAELSESDNMATPPPPPATDQEPGNCETPPAKEKPLPEMKMIIKDWDYFEAVLSKKSDYCRFDRTDDKYYWTKSKSLLAGFVITLRDKGRLKNPENFMGFEIENNQDLGRVFCKYFNIEYSYKRFQPDEIKPNHKKPFALITDF